MAIKDLPSSFLVDLYKLAAWSDQFLYDYAESTAGKKPRFVGKSSKENRPPTLTIIKKFPIRAELTKLISGFGFNQIKTTQGETGTFPAKYTDYQTWENQFFILRTQVVGVVNSNDPVLAAFDAIWNKISLVTGEWRGGSGK